MSRLLLLSAAAVPLLADASLKGAALLALAGVCVLAMRRASAASRHMVWLAAVVALLVLPMLAVVLPGWRVLPQWAPSGADAVEPQRPVEPDAAYTAHDADTPLPRVEQPTVPAHAPLPTPANLPAAESWPMPPPAPVPASTAAAAPLTAWLLLPLWTAGCAVLLLRLVAAHFLLRRNARRCEPATGPLAAALEAAREECGVRRPVRVLVDNARTIPVVWGIFRPQLLLPGEAEHWDATRLRSVLLHELAHLRRRDPLTQFLTQLACALHWFNPLVWLAAWRLHVERERACDDLVLSRGVKPSAYAEHLLHIATQLSPARWTQACGLAMARKSSLEGRLVAVLSDQLNRRSVTRTLAAAAILLSTAIAVPVAMLRAAPPTQSDRSQPKPTGKLIPTTEAKLQWGEPVNGLRMALAFPPSLKDPVIGDDPYFKLVIQNASDKEMHFIANKSEPNPRRMLWREDERIIQSLSDEDPSPADVRLQPGECTVLRLFTKEQRSDDGKTISELLEGDLAGGPRYHVIATMEITNAPAGAWTGKLTTGHTRGSADIAPAVEKSKSGGVEQRRKVNWSKPPPDSFFEGTYDPELLARLAAVPEKLNEDTESGTKVWPLAEQILRAAVEGDPQFRHLLTDEKLKAADTDNRILTMSLAAYDFSVFDKKAALKVILDQLEHGQHEAYLAAFPLGFVDEWDQSVPAIERVFAQRDGGKGDAYHEFWAHREWIFPASYAAFQKKQLEANKLDAASLQGVWKGSKEDVDVTLRFGKSQDWEVSFLKTNRKSALSTKPSYTATSLSLMGANEKGTPVHCGTLSRGSDGALLLHLLEHGPSREDLGYRRVNEMVLTKKTDAPESKEFPPSAAEARPLLRRRKSRGARIPMHSRRWMISSNSRRPRPSHRRTWIG